MKPWFAIFFCFLGGIFASCQNLSGGQISPLQTFPPREKNDQGVDFFPKTVIIASSGGVKIGDMAPSFGGWTLSDQIVSLKELITLPKTQAVLVSFFATWCTPCKKGLAMLKSHSDKLEQEGLRVLLVNIQEAKELVQKFLIQEKLPFQTILDPFAIIASKYGITGDQASLPRSFLIGPDLKIWAIYSAEGEDYVAQILKDAKGEKGEKVAVP